MPRLPARRTVELEVHSPRHLAKAQRSAANTEMAIYRHALAARYRAETDRLDSEALADAARASLEAELDLLEHGMRRAAGSQAKTELVARKVEMLSSINNQRIARNSRA